MDIAVTPKPVWLRRPPASRVETRALKHLLRKAKLNTVCEEARCPNINECFSRATATFMILGDVCTRGCRFCSIATGQPHFSPSQFRQEAVSVAEAADQLGLRHVVVTSVTRDDLLDGGASGFCETIAALRQQLDDVTVEVLVPDFRGNRESVARVVEAGPDVFNHNLESVPRLYRRVRPGASYEGSLEVLYTAHQMRPEMITKTGIMLGLGETPAEVCALMDDCRKHGVQSFTAGQYLQPTRTHLPVERYLRAEEFDEYERLAREFGFRYVAIGPLVRSSYHADEFVH